MVWIRSVLSIIGLAKTAQSFSPTNRVNNHLAYHYHQKQQLSHNLREKSTNKHRYYRYSPIHTARKTGNYNPDDDDNFEGKEITSELIKNIGNENNGDYDRLGIFSKKNTGKYDHDEDWTPNRFEYPWISSSSNKMENDVFRNRKKLDDRLSLDRAIPRIIEALEHLQSNLLLEENQNMKQSVVRRITQPLSHLVDPLAWLDAQRYDEQINCHDDNWKEKSSIAQGYFANVDQTEEAAYIGSLKTFHHLLGGNNYDPGSKNEVNSQQKQVEWEWIESNLPFSSRVYGASKFDTTSTLSSFSANDKNENVNENDPSLSNPQQKEHYEWDAFFPKSDNKDDNITGIWVLPAVELRRFQINDDDDGSDPKEEMALSVHIILDHTNVRKKNVERLQKTINLLRQLSSSSSITRLPTTMPPIVSRTYIPTLEYDEGPFEKGIEAALETFADPTNPLQKTVMARRADLHFSSDEIRGLDVVKRLKYGGQHVGYLFYIQSSNDLNVEFISGTPERLFSINPESLEKNIDININPDGNAMKKTSGWIVRSEALAGTRPRGSTLEADEELLQELIHSEKDRSENMITRQFINGVFEELQNQGKIYDFHFNKNENRENVDDIFYVRRLSHVQHICQTVQGKLADSSMTIDVARNLLNQLHPTPAVCGFPSKDAMKLIRRYEGQAFDRGLYAGPAGYIGKESSDVIVAIRSGVFETEKTNFADSQNNNLKNDEDVDDDIGETITSRSKGSVFRTYAGAGIVLGSTVQGEWTETSQKLGVLASQFFPSPVNIQSINNPNVAWATIFIEELIRNGVTQFYVCPGSRSTPLTAAIARAMRSHTGIINAVSVHDERSAAFRALGYGRGNNKAAVVITSSGTAVANLYPAIMEAGTDGIPLLLLTADRPYESRDNGSNQSVDQVKVFSSTYVRWFRDIPPPNDDVPISLALSDASHAVVMTKDLRGPVHLNIQFRENLAPDTGPIRNDDRAGSITQFDSKRFTDVPGFQRWNLGGNKWMKSYSSLSGSNICPSNAAADIIDLIRKSKRGMIVVGNIRGVSSEKNSASDVSTIAALISDFAQKIGFPIFAGAQSSYLRYQSPTVIPYAEHLLKHPLLKSNLKPDLILQFGSPLISSEISSIILDASKNDSHTCHVLVHPPHPNERADPIYTVTHRISSEVVGFIQSATNILDKSITRNPINYGSDLAPLVIIGRILADQMPSIIHTASRTIVEKRKKIWEDQESERSILNDDDSVTASLTEPQVVLALSEVITNSCKDQSFMSLFLSNSMPVRDAEFFLYPPSSYFSRSSINGQCAISVNRGASGIDGIISSATGHAEATKLPTTLLIGDLATLHDLNSFHNLAKKTSSAYPNYYQPSLTTVVINNNGGGIFSFLPISKYGDDVGFEEFFGTPTNSFSFSKGSEAFGIPFEMANSYENFKISYRNSFLNNDANVIEAQVLGREENVLVHREITRMTNHVIDELFRVEESNEKAQIFSSENHLKLPIKLYHDDENHLSKKSKDSLNLKSKTKDNYWIPEKEKKVLILLHGWLGDKSEWDQVCNSLMEKLSREWKIISIDLPGHGEAPLLFSEEQQILNGLFGRHNSISEETKLSEYGTYSYASSLDALATSVLYSLLVDHGINRIDAVCGYSLGGRVALAMKRLSSLNSPSPIELDNSTNNKRSDLSAQSLQLIHDDTSLILLGSNPGNLPQKKDESQIESADAKRLINDDNLSRTMQSIVYQSLLKTVSPSQSTHDWAKFVTTWYESSLWGDLKRRKPVAYASMMRKRVKALSYRALDMAKILSQCSPSRSSKSDWRHIVPSKTLFLSGSLDSKYSEIGDKLSEAMEELRVIKIPDAGHALLIDAPEVVSKTISQFLLDNDMTSFDQSDKSPRENTFQGIFEPSIIKARSSSRTLKIQIGTLDFDTFTIPLTNENKKTEGIYGIGWGRKSKKQVVTERNGVIINLSSPDGSLVGIGEVSPLSGLHPESLEEAQNQIRYIQKMLKDIPGTDLPYFDAHDVLSLDGSIGVFLQSLSRTTGVEKEFGSEEFLPSVRAGLEMSVISIAAMAIGKPLPQALLQNVPKLSSNEKKNADTNSLYLNGLITKSSNIVVEQNQYCFSSMKIKVGHDKPVEDANLAYSVITAGDSSSQKQKVRADANRAWDMKAAIEFSSAMKEYGLRILNNLEFVEEPLDAAKENDGKWSIEHQVDLLEEWHDQSDIFYALDESLADLISIEKHDFLSIADRLRKLFTSDNRAKGCAVMVLKPSLLGFELSMQLARLAHTELGIGAVLSSSFDSGVGLAYTSFLGVVSDHLCTTLSNKKYCHGLGTFTMLTADTLSPPFSSYVNKGGKLDVLSLGKAMYGLDIEEIQDSHNVGIESLEEESMIRKNDFSKKPKVVRQRRKISVNAAIPLPFSDKIACSRFSDLPQQPRWCPWIKSVKYLDSNGGSEWALKVRGKTFRWRAVSKVLHNPSGIIWESVSGLKNQGSVTFIKTSEDSCLMKVKIDVLVSPIVTLLFRTIDELARDFIEDKLLKWSLESFRDVVKADLALERGDVELGDALFGAVEGRNYAIEAALFYPRRNSEK